MNINPKQDETIERLVSAINAVYLDKKKLFARSFLAGLFSGLGATVGLSIVLIIVGVILHYAGGLPVIGQYLQGLNSIIPVSQK